MTKAKEFTVTIEDKPGALGKCFVALAEHGVNVLAFQSYVEERESLIRFLADDQAGVETVLGRLDILRNAVRMSGAPPTVRAPSPDAGDHSDQVLTELGYPAAEIDGLRARGVI